MTKQETYLDLDELVADVGKAGQRLSQIDACEGAAGNISVCVGWHLDPHRHFPREEKLSLPISAPELAGVSLLVTGSGCRLRDISSDPEANLGMVTVSPGGKTARLFTQSKPAFRHITSEFNSHLAIHYAQFQQTGAMFHAVVHAQPLHLTFLSHIARYREQDYLNRHLLRWQPELIVNLPDGLGVVPFFVPGSDDLMRATLEKLRSHHMVVWSKHGVIVRSDESALRASDRIEYVETAARYEHLNLRMGEIADGLSPEEIQAIVAAFDIEQHLF